MTKKEAAKNIRAKHCLCDEALFGCRKEECPYYVALVALEQSDKESDERKEEP